MWLFLLFVAVPIIEIALFIEVGGAIGTWQTVGVIILTALIGTALLRHQGLAALRSAQSRLMAGEDPGLLVADGLMILIAGVLLLTPGFFTDAIGFLLLMPPVRRLIWRRLASKVVVQGMHPHTRRDDPGTVDGSFEDITPGSERPTEGPNPPLR